MRTREMPSLRQSSNGRAEDSTTSGTVGLMAAQKEQEQLDRSLWDRLPLTFASLQTLIHLWGRGNAEGPREQPAAGDKIKVCGACREI